MGKIDDITDNMSALIVGVVMLCSAVIPVAISQIDALSLIESTVVDVSTMQSLLTVAIIMAILGLVIVVVRQYKSKER